MRSFHPFDALGWRGRADHRGGNSRGDLSASVIGCGSQRLLARWAGGGAASCAALIRHAHLAAMTSIPESGDHNGGDYYDGEDDAGDYGFGHRADVAKRRSSPSGGTCRNAVVLVPLWKDRRESAATASAQSESSGQRPPDPRGLHLEARERWSRLIRV